MLVNKVQNNQNNYSFKGVSGLIANSSRNELGKFTLIAAKLNNLGTNDLELFQRLKRVANFKYGNPDEDLICFSLLQKSKGQKFFSLDGNLLPDGNDLLKFERDKKLHPEYRDEINEYEAITFKAYTFLADLTKRLMNPGNVKRDWHDTAQVGTYACYNIMRDGGSQNFGISFVSEAIQRPDIYSKIAESLNNNIMETMKLFFCK